MSIRWLENEMARLEDEEGVCSFFFPSDSQHLSQDSSSGKFYLRDPSTALRKLSGELKK